MDKIEETYQKLIDKIVQFEDENKNLFAVANGMEIMYDCRIPFPFLGLKKTTRRAMEFISKASSSEFLFKKVSSVTFVCYGEYSHKCIDKSIEYHRPQLRILFEGDTGQWGYKKSVNFGMIFMTISHLISSVFGHIRVAILDGRRIPSCS